MLMTRLEEGKSERLALIGEILDCSSWQRKIKNRIQASVTYTLLAAGMAQLRIAPGSRFGVIREKKIRDVPLLGSSRSSASTSGASLLSIISAIGMGKGWELISVFVRTDLSAYLLLYLLKVRLS